MDIVGAVPITWQKLKVFDANFVDKTNTFLWHILQKRRYICMDRSVNRYIISYTYYCESLIKHGVRGCLELPPITLVSRDLVREKPLLRPQCLPIVFDFTAGQRPCYILYLSSLLSIMHNHDTHATRSYWNRPGTKLTIGVQPNQRRFFYWVE